MKKTLPPRGCIVPFFAVFMLLGAAAAIFGFQTIRTAEASLSWPTARGVITASNVEHVRSSKGRSSYSPVVTYHYEVGGVIYKGERIRMSRVGSSDPSEAQADLRRYRMNQAVTVSYDPEDPASSLLETGVAATDWLLAGVGCVFILLPAVFLWIFLRSHRRQAAQTTD